MIKVNDPTVQKAFEDIDKDFAKKRDVAPKQSRRFDGLNEKLVDQLEEGESANVRDTDGTYYRVRKIDGKLFRTGALTEV